MASGHSSSWPVPSQMPPLATRGNTENRLGKIERDSLRDRSRYRLLLVCLYLYLLLNSPLLLTPSSTTAPSFRHRQEDEGVVN